MDPLDFRGIHLDDCPQCGGVWFDDGELNELKNLGDELAMASLEDRAVPAGCVQVVEQKSKMCPVCNERLTPFKYMYTSELVLDECDNCFGVWVQDGELEKMAAVLEDHEPKLSQAKREVIAAVAAEVEMVRRSRKNRAKSMVAFWTIFGTSRPGRPQ
jgi:uncharacterized protein